MRNRTKEYPSSNKRYKIQNGVDIDWTSKIVTKYIRVIFIYIYKAKLEKEISKPWLKT